MPSRNNTKNTVFSGENQTSSVMSEYFTINYQNSPREGGKLRLRQNPLSFQHLRTMNAQAWPGTEGTFWPPPDVGGFGILPPGVNWDTLDTLARAKLRGKLFKGSASMGVTLASWKQSRDMIVDRSRNLQRRLDSTIHALQGHPGARRRLVREREPLANQVLEGEFGWKPLFQDMHSALFTVCKDGIPPEFVRASARAPVQYNVTRDSFPRTRWSIDGYMRVTASTKVAISNPNLWLLNRMGLINPATVVWDLIPWSFVVNMFLNVNAMINSVTDEVGLTFSDMATTRSVLVGHDFYRWEPAWEPWRGPSSARHLYKTKSREVGALPQTHWQFKVPELNWELAAIAASLVVQKFKTINKLIRVL